MHHLQRGTMSDDARTRPVYPYTCYVHFLIPQRIEFYYVLNHTKVIADVTKYQMD